ncbi:calcineurin-like phosphoesterase C-terminal domain-containing protein [Sphingobacterium sp. LRF_L2]|uniref:calcineurin-like phosphoesterase C-terminal domain-containing protein n=1 Tax=Sphingobacterium sp. LRF_L2 TaxID=3369421 RepID=UPI003F5EFBDE
MKRFTYIFFVLCTVCVRLMAQDKVVTHVVSGQVFQDKNQNGILDGSEKGLNGILVSNGVDVIKTDKKGKFLMEVKKGQSIFPILPSEYTFINSSSKVGNANFRYLNPHHALADTVTIQIPLQRITKVNTFSIGAIGDIQVENSEELNYAAKSIFSELMQRRDIAFHMMLGDLINDDVRILPDVKQVMAQLPVKSWTLVGNHDRNTDNPEFMNDAFNENFGADHYAFNYGDVHFIVLNNVFSTGKRAYEGRLSDEQLLFLKNDLQFVPKERTIVFSQHIPLAFTRGRDDIMKLLAGYKKVLVLSGHTHTVNRYHFSASHIHELGAGATCGNWWRGEKDAKGVPDALMQCGTPRGYFVVDFNKGDYAINFKGVGKDDREQMALYTDSNKFVVNVYAGSDSTDVWMRVDQMDWVKLTHVRRIDPLVQQIIAKNNGDIYPTEGNSKNPLGKRASSHIWEMDIPQNFRGKMGVIRVKASDSYGLDVEQEFVLSP